MLEQLKHKQRAEEGQLNREAKKAKKEYHEQLKHPQPVKNNKKSDKDNHGTSKKNPLQLKRKLLALKF